MSAGRAELDAFIAGVESLRNMNALVAKEAEEGVADAVRATAKAAETPDGKPWPDLAEGGKALRDAPGAIESSTRGTAVELKIGKPYVFHNRGSGGSSTTKEAERHRKRAETTRAKTGTKSKFHAPQRQILPLHGQPIPAPMKEAITEAAARVFSKAVG